MNIPEPEDQILKYASKPVEELSTLKESYEEEIKWHYENHWTTVFKNKTKIDIKKILIIVEKILLLIFGIAMIIFFGFFFKDIVTQGKPELIMELFEKYFVWVFIYIIPLSIIPSLVNDGTSPFRNKLYDVNLVLSKKEKIVPAKGKSKKNGIIVDTNIFDDIANSKIKVSDFEQAKNKGYEFYITHIQSDEISKCKDEDKRAKLTLFLTVISPTVLKTESLVAGLSRVGFSKLGEGDIIEKIQGKNKNLRKAKDALIGETALKNNLILLTNDKKFRNKILNLKGKVMDHQEFKNTIESE